MHLTSPPSLSLLTEFNCSIRDSRFAVFSSDNDNALAASIVGIIVLLVTVAYIWWVLFCSNSVACCIDS